MRAMRMKLFLVGGTASRFTFSTVLPSMNGLETTKYRPQNGLPLEMRMIRVHRHVSVYFRSFALFKSQT